MRRPSGEKSGQASLAGESAVRFTAWLPSGRLFQMSTFSEPAPNGAPTPKASQAPSADQAGPHAEFSPRYRSLFTRSKIVRLYEPSSREITRREKASPVATSERSGLSAGI